MTFPLVSVVVTTKNEVSNIENCLKSIIEQDYPNIEIIVATDKGIVKICNIQELMPYAFDSLDSKNI